MKMKEIGPRRGQMYEQWLIQKLPGTVDTMFLKSIENNTGHKQNHFDPLDQPILI